jgi:hypothetical protein
VPDRLFRSAVSDSLYVHQRTSKIIQPFSLVASYQLHAPSKSVTATSSDTGTHQGVQDRALGETKPCGNWRTVRREECGDVALRNTPGNLAFEVGLHLIGNRHSVVPSGGPELIDRSICCNCSDDENLVVVELNDDGSRKPIGGDKAIQELVEIVICCHVYKYIHLLLDAHILVLPRQSVIRSEASLLLDDLAHRNPAAV